MSSDRLDPIRISVVIPLYNKEAEIERAVRSALGQSLRPLEVIVVDDGSTDGSAETVRRIDDPLLRLIRQPNLGVSAARNRAIEEAKGDWVALLDADDEWLPGYLDRIARLIAAFPGCGAYGTSFYVREGERLHPVDTPAREGIVDFFAEAMHRYVLIPSAVTLNRRLTLSLGGFPVGMKLGEDQYLWTRIARTAAVCCAPERLVCYSRSASNRSASIYTAESSPHSLEELYDPQASEASNEYLARVALGKALTVSVRGGRTEAQRAARSFRYTRLNRRLLIRLRVLNALPLCLRKEVARLYDTLAWKLRHRGF